MIWKNKRRAKIAANFINTRYPFLTLRLSFSLTSGGWIWIWIVQVFFSLSPETAPQQDDAQR